MDGVCDFDVKFGVLNLKSDSIFRMINSSKKLPWSDPTPFNDSFSPTPYLLISLIPYFHLLHSAFHTPHFALPISLSPHLVIFILGPTPFNEIIVASRLFSCKL